LGSIHGPGYKRWDLGREKGDIELSQEMLDIYFWKPVIGSSDKLWKKKWKCPHSEFEISFIWSLPVA
jgi:hypothetical protein